MANRVIAIDTGLLPWKETTAVELGLAQYRTLAEDPETGVEIRIVRYPAGVMMPRHAHLSAEAMYVLDGELVTWAGTHGPGAFVWFPAGAVAEHGASKEGDATVLLISTRPSKPYFVYH